jgi:hypothetical protein
MSRARRVALSLVALLAVASIATGCQQTLTCDVSVFGLGTDPIGPGDVIPADAELILNAGDFDPGQATIGPIDLGTEVQLHLDPGAAQRFREFTAANLGGFIAVTLNGSVVSVPMIQSEIPDGALSITMPPTSTEEIDAFARCIQRRALPEP